ncbi:hypothetical protein [Desulfonatronospira sp.]|uniref:hypothetical protein n=1 Tax=Desulfonatronospira sp. TaxID=1962951 RepID=UPI0025BDB4C0|nr:hypothetical protein [Desulfonatronospira sp.]
MGHNITSRVKEFLLSKSVIEHRELPSDFDLLEMPLEAVLAYWLSVGKVMESRDVSFLQRERDNTSEPYIRHLLGLLASSLPAEKLEKYAGVKKKTIIDDLQRKFVLMSISVLGMSTNENPQKVLIRIISKFSISPVYEKEIFEAAQSALAGLDKDEAHKKRFLNVDHRLKLETLILNLIIHNMLSRRLGRNELKDFVQYVRSFYFAEGLSYIIDGFDYDFVKYRLNLQKKAILDLTETKMDMSLNMCSGIKSGLSYNDLKLIGSSYLL